MPLFENRTRYECPVDDCEWTFTDRSFWPRNAEPALRSHMESHDVADFARTIANLQAELRRVETSH